MPLSIIGAGFGRTGTSSMKQALELLGVGPCHHMSEVLSLDDQRTKWKAIANGTKPDWDDVFANYNASVDWPSSHYWRDLAEHFPNAKILLTVRSSESWYTSMTNTIFKVLKEENEPDGVGTRIITEATFGGILDDKDHAIAIFEKTTSSVNKAWVPTTISISPSLIFEINFFLSLPERELVRSAVLTFDPLSRFEMV
mgnify:CR=1 FL=1